MTVFRLAFAACLATAIAGCAIFAPSPDDAPDQAAWQEHQQDLSEIVEWKLRGRIATGRLLGWTGNMIWRQQRENFDVRVSGPMGVGGFRANGTPQMVNIRSKDVNVTTRTPEAYFEDLIGWQFPLRHLRYWAMGMPSPGTPHDLRVDGAGHLVWLSQDGWELEYSEYGSFSGEELPTRIVLTQGNKTVRVIISDWYDLS